MADDVLSLRYFVDHYSLPATVRVINGYEQLEEGDEVTLESVRYVRGVEALLGRHGENLVLSFLPFEYGGIFEVIVAPPSQPWSRYREFSTAGDIIKAGIELPLALKAKSNWRGLSESDSVYQQDIFTSLSVKTDANGRCFVQSINQRGMVVCLTDSARGDFTTDLSDTLMGIEDVVKLFESNFPVRVRLRALPPDHEDFIMCVGDTLMLQRVISRQEVKVTGIGDVFSAVVDDFVDVMMIGHTQGRYINVARSSKPLKTTADGPDEEDYVPMMKSPVDKVKGILKKPKQSDEEDYVHMGTPSVDEMQQILRARFSDLSDLESQLAQQEQVIRDLREMNNSLEVKQKDEQSQNEELRAVNEFLKGELQAMREEQEAALALNAADKVRSLEAQVRQLEVDKNQTASEVQNLYSEIDRQKKGNEQLSLMRQENTHLKEKLKDEQSQNEEMRAGNEFLKGELLAMREEQEAALALNAVDKVRSLEAQVRQLEVDKDQTASEVQTLYSTIDRQKKGNEQLSLLRQENTHLKEKLMSLEEEKKALLGLLEEARQEKEREAHTPNDTTLHQPRPGIPSQLSDQAVPSSPTPVPRPRGTRSSVVSTVPVSPVPVSPVPVSPVPVSPVPVSPVPVPPVPVPARRHTKQEDSPVSSAVLPRTNAIHPPPTPRRRNMLASNASDN